MTNTTDQYAEDAVQEIVAASGGKCWEDPGAVEALRIAFAAGRASLATDEARADAQLFGIGFTVDGHRVHPARVVVIKPAPVCNGDLCICAVACPVEPA